MLIVAAAVGGAGVGKEGGDGLSRPWEAVVADRIVLGHEHVVGELHVLEGPFAAELLDLFQELAGFAMARVQVEGE